MYLAKIITRVLAVLKDHEIRVVVGPGEGSLDGGLHQTCPLKSVPTELRFPNAEFWLVHDEYRGEPRIELMERET